MIRRPPRSTLFPTRRSSDLRGKVTGVDDDRLADEFETHRARLRAVAFRMLGSGTEADDAVQEAWLDRKSTRLNSSHANISYAVFCLKKKKTRPRTSADRRRS